MQPCWQNPVNEWWASLKKKNLPTTIYLVVGLQGVSKYSSSDNNAGNILENNKLAKLNICRVRLKVVGHL